MERGAVTVENSWVRVFFKTDVYMVEAMINKGLANEQKIEVPVRVDQKAVLSPDELKTLEEEDIQLDAGEPVFRVTGEPVAEEVSPGAGHTIYYIYIAAAVLAALILGTILIIRRRAIKHK
ncbi:MAG: hypothetical protein AB1445_01275 [Bacillota bacterium]